MEGWTVGEGWLHFSCVRLSPSTGVRGGCVRVCVQPVPPLHPSFVLPPLKLPLSKVDRGT